MQDSSSVTKDSKKTEMGGVHVGDEAELAKMGYKQELRYVRVNLCTLFFQNS